MPLKVTCGLSRKVGVPDYGSLGANCQVEFELDGLLLQTDVAAFHRQVKNAYVACAQAVSDELARHQEASPAQCDTESPQSSRRSSNGNGHRASQKQLDYASQLAREIPQLGMRRLEELANKLHSRPLADLSSFEASSLIDTLKAIKEGRVDADAALNGPP